MIIWLEEQNDQNHLLMAESITQYLKANNIKFRYANNLILTSLLDPDQEIDWKNVINCPSVDIDELNNQNIYKINKYRYEWKIPQSYSISNYLYAIVGLIASFFIITEHNNSKLINSSNNTEKISGTEIFTRILKLITIWSPFMMFLILDGDIIYNKTNKITSIEYTINKNFNIITRFSRYKKTLIFFYILGSLVIIHAIKTKLEANNESF